MHLKPLITGINRKIHIHPIVSITYKQNYRFGVTMRIGVALFGISLVILGIILMALFWPMIDYETEESFDLNAVNRGDTIKYVGEITDITESGGIYLLELDNGVLEAYTDEEGFNRNENVLVTIEFGNNITNWDENAYYIQKIPSAEGYFGLVLAISGFVVLTAGVVTKKETIEDLIRFTIQSAVEPTTQPTAPSTAQPPATQGSRTPQIEHVKCPKCNKIFGVEGVARPGKISCPECGLEGSLE